MTFEPGDIHHPAVVFAALLQRLYDSFVEPVHVMRIEKLDLENVVNVVSWDRDSLQVRFDAINGQLHFVLRDEHPTPPRVGNSMYKTVDFDLSQVLLQLLNDVRTACLV